MTEDIQAKQYHASIEEEDEFEIEEEEEETITLDFDKGVAIQEGVIVGEGLLDKMASAMEEKIVAKGMVTAFQSPDETVFTDIVETPEGYDEAAKEAEEKEKREEAAEKAVAAARTYRDDLADLFIDTLANKAVGQLIDQHIKIETDVIDNLSKTHRRMGKAYNMHEQAILKSIDSKRHELRRSYGYGGRLSYEHIPAWAKPYIEDYIRDFIHEITSLTRDVD